MFIKKLYLKKFRCFTEKLFSFDKKCIVIEGCNGSGKTSILEALYYMCYLRSFRTHLSRELIHFDAKHFFVGVHFKTLKDETEHKISVGFSENGNKLVKLDERPLTSYADLIEHYRIISMIEHDIFLIQGAPEVRRAFLDQSLSILDAHYLSFVKQYRKVLLNRNTLLTRLQHSSSFNKAYKNDELRTWTESLWKLSVAMSTIRIQFLQKLDHDIKALLKEAFSLSTLDFSCSYQSKNIKNKGSFDLFWQEHCSSYLEREIVKGRSLFGAHLDDFIIHFHDKRARLFASRGQQKLMVFLIKIAEFLQLHNAGYECIMLLDDFLTDFDDELLSQCLSLLESQEGIQQMFITTPTNSSKLLNFFQGQSQLITFL